MYKLKACQLILLLVLILVEWLSELLGLNSKKKNRLSGYVFTAFRIAKQDHLSNGEKIIIKSK